MPAEDAAFATIAAIALHGLRIAEVGPGAKVVVLGLGLIGQLAARLAMAAGCDVAGIDPAGHARHAAAASGVLALDEAGEATTGQVLAWSRGRGADAVLVCAAGRSSDAVMRVPALCRDRAPVVIVGDVGLHLDRTPFYERELSVRFARSYGPGRYEPSYEAWGVDFPAGQVRWTEGRNFEAVLDLLASGRLQVADLVTHTFGIAEAEAAYQLIERRAEPYLAIRLAYPAPAGAGPGGAGAGRGRPAQGPAPGELVPRDRLGRGGRVLHRHAAARVPRRRVRPFRRRGLRQRAVRPPGRRAARLREGGARRGCAHRRPAGPGGGDRHPARHARGPGRPGPVRRAARLVREARGADRGRAGPGGEGLA